jgi:hypothetical protein
MQPWQARGSQWSNLKSTCGLEGDFRPFSPDGMTVSLEVPEFFDEIVGLAFYWAKDL